MFCAPVRTLDEGPYIESDNKNEKAFDLNLNKAFVFNGKSVSLKEISKKVEQKYRVSRKVKMFKRSRANVTLHNSKLFLA